MKRAAATLLMFVVLLFIADALRAWLQSFLEKAYVDPESTFWFANVHKYVFAGILIYSAPFAVAGVILAWRAKSAGLGCLLAGLLGAAIPSFHALYDGGARPFIFFTHAPRWLEPLFWGNLYMPVIASLLGALLWVYFAPRTSVRNAA